MKYIPFLNLLILAVIPYLFAHEKKHARFTVYLRQICAKLGIECDERD